MNTVVCKFCRGAIAALAIVAANAASAASTNEYTAIDIMETVRQSEVASPFTATFTGEQPGSVSMQLFDGDLSADNNKDADQNGRALFVVNNGPTVTVSFNPAAFGNRPISLGQYGFRMANVSTASSWQIANRLPAAWTVKVSDKENPSSDDDWVLVDSHSGLTSSSYSLVNSCYTADFSLELPMPFRHVRFAFTGTTGNNGYVQLGEICMSGLIAPDEAGRRDVCLYKTSPVSANADGSETLQALIFPAGAEVDPYDLFVVYRTGDRVATNLLEHATQFTGLYEATIPGLRLDADYTLQFGTIATNGTVELGEVVGFSTAFDVMPGGMLPVGYEMVEYIESTDTGHQYIDCGFAPSDVVLGFDLDFIGYNAFQRAAYHDTDDRDTCYGVYLSSTVKGQNAQVLVSSSTGGGGGYPDGLFVYSGSAKAAKLTRGERMSVLLGNGKYTTICGTTTNEQSITRGRITGPTLSLFASENGSGNDPDQFAAMRLYSLKVYDDTVARTLTHEFVPAKRVADGVYGVYDIVAHAWCPNGSTNQFLAGPVVSDGRLELEPLSYEGHTVTATLTRGGTAAADVYAAWGATYGGVDAAAWEHTAKCGEFAANVSSAEFTTPNMGLDTIYVRFYSADGEWSETIYLPDPPPPSSGSAHFYVATTGSDDDAGTVSAPFLTLSNAVAQANAAIDGGADDVTIHVAAGTYDISAYDTEIELAKAITVVGNPTNPVSVRVLNNSTVHRSFLISHADAAVKGLTMDRESGSVSVYGANVSMSAGLVEDCIIQNGSVINPSGAAAGGNVVMNGDDVNGTATLRRCKILNGYARASSTAQVATGNIYTHYGTFKIIENCLISGGVAENGTFDTSHPNSCVGNIQSQSPCAIVNCTVVNGEAVGCGGLTLGYCPWASPRGRAVVNCVMYGNSGTTILPSTHHKDWSVESGLGYANCFTNCAASDIGTSGGGGWQAIDATAFVDFSAGDYTPSVGSALVDNGTSWSYYLATGASSTTDLAGMQRSDGAALDIGCYETPQNAPDVLAVTTTAQLPGSVIAPSLGYLRGIAAGQSLTASAKAEVWNAEHTKQEICTGYKLYDSAGECVGQGSAASFTYVHPDPAEYRWLEWQYVTNTWLEAASAYVQDGLIAQWDGVENAGVGVHNKKATTWKPLVGSGEFIFPNGANVVSNCFDMLHANRTSAGGYTTNAAAIATAIGINRSATVEVVCDFRSMVADGTIIGLLDGGMDRRLFWTRSANTSGLKGCLSVCEYMRTAWHTAVNVAIDINVYNQVRTYHFVCQSANCVVRKDGEYKTSVTKGPIDSSSVNVSNAWLSIGRMWAPSSELTPVADAKIYAIRVYNRQLSVEEMEANAEIDHMRFALGQYVRPRPVGFAVYLK